MAADARIHVAIDALAAPPGVLIGHRLISTGDELALLPQENQAFAARVEKVRRASGAARIAARGLLAQLGHIAAAIPKTASGAPVWPDEIVGSLAHDSEVAVAAVARRKDAAGLGIDIEPAQLLDADLLRLVATDRERRTIADDPYGGRLLFAVKEAVYKATNPLDGVFLEHHDVEVDLKGGIATVRNGRKVAFRYAVTSHILVLALI